MHFSRSHLGFMLSELVRSDVQESRYVHNLFIRSDIKSWNYKPCFFTKRISLLLRSSKLGFFDQIKRNRKFSEKKIIIGRFFLMSKIQGMKDENWHFVGFEIFWQWTLLHFPELRCLYYFAFRGAEWWKDCQAVAWHSLSTLIQNGWHLGILL